MKAAEERRSMEFIEETTAPDLEWLLMVAGAEKILLIQRTGATAGSRRKFLTLS